MDSIGRTCGAFALAFGSVSFADVEVIKLSGIGTYTVHTLEEVEGQWNVVITAANVTLAVEADEEDIIRYVRVEANDDPETAPIDTVTVLVRAKPSTSGRVVRLREFIFTSDDETDDGHLILDANVLKTSGGSEGNIGGSGTTQDGVVSVHAMTLVAAGDLTAAVTALDRLDSSFAPDILAVSVGGDVLGSIEADNTHGVIHSISVGGDIGSPGNPILIESENGIGDISAEAIHAYILSRIGTEEYKPIRRVEARSGDCSGIIGGTTFTTTYGSGTPGLYVDGDLSSFVYVGGDLTAPIEVGGDLTSDGTIWIGEFLGDDITVAASGLKGQVIINAWEYSATWEADVIVGTTILSPVPLYTNTGFGGGAVGEVPFGCHLQGCVPPMSSGGGWAATTNANQVVESWHYGPIMADSGSKPFTVGVCTSDSDCDPQDDTNNWEVVLGPSGRVMKIKRSNGLVTDRHYHVKPIRNPLAGDPLYCAGIPSQFTPVRDYTYTIEVDLP